jgi:hypothetical protein
MKWKGFLFRILIWTKIIVRLLCNTFVRSGDALSSSFGPLGFVDQNFQFSLKFLNIVLTWKLWATCHTHVSSSSRLSSNGETIGDATWHVLRIYIVGIPPSPILHWQMLPRSSKFLRGNGTTFLPWRPEFAITIAHVKSESWKGWVQDLGWQNYTWCVKDD